MRPLLVLVAALFIHCGTSTSSTSPPVNDLSAPTAPADLATSTRPDCGGLLACPCGDGSCPWISACGTTTCADACSSHGGPNGNAVNCTGDGGP